jgi:hypothetical protein
MDKLVRFIVDEQKLVAELEQEQWARSNSIPSIETSEVDLGLMRNRHQDHGSQLSISDSYSSTQSWGSI